MRGRCQQHIIHKLATCAILIIEIVTSIFIIYQSAGAGGEVLRYMCEDHAASVCSRF